MTHPIGSIRKTELLDTLRALALARPDLAEALALVAVATGLSEDIRLPRRVVDSGRRQLKSETDNES